MSPQPAPRGRARRAADRTAAVVEGLQTVIAVAILAAAIGGFVASRTGDGDGVAVAAVGAFLLAAVATAVVLAVRGRRDRR